MASRVQNSQKNLVMNMLSQAVAILLSFVSRSVFINTLGVEYLGINGLFTNILSVLSLAELGIGTAIVYSMYKPLAEKDEKKLAALTQYYKNLYTAIAVIVLIVGLAIVPFLDLILNLEQPIENVKIYYLMFLAEAVTSYLIIYRTSIITADQKGYIITRNRMIANFVTVILQVIVLLLTQNYILYLIIHISVPLACNYYNSRIAVKIYPYIVENEKLDKQEKKAIWDNIKSMFFYKLGGVILNNTSNIIISILISTAIVGLYSNYSMLILRVSTFTSLIFSSVQASLGNLNVVADSKKQYDVFNVLSLVSFWVYGFCSICFCILFQDFIMIWLGSEQFLLSDVVVYIAVMNFYFQGVLYPIWCYRQTTGLFRDTKYTMLIAAVINIILSVILGKKFGLAGIFVATVISRLVTNIWFDPYVLFKKYFKTSVLGYYFKEGIRLLLLAVFIGISIFAFEILAIENIWISFVIKILYCVVVPNVIFLLIYYRTDEFKYLWNIAKKLLKK